MAKPKEIVMRRLLWQECLRNRWILVIGFAGVLLGIFIVMTVNAFSQSYCHMNLGASG